MEHRIGSDRDSDRWKDSRETDGQEREEDELWISILGQRIEADSKNKLRRTHIIFEDGQANGSILKLMERSWSVKNVYKCDLKRFGGNLDEKGHKATEVYDADFQEEPDQQRQGDSDGEEDMDEDLNDYDEDEDLDNDSNPDYLPLNQDPYAAPPAPPQQTVQKEPWVRKRKAGCRTSKLVNTKKPRRQCPFLNCGAFIVNVSQHVKGVHAGVKLPKSVKKVPTSRKKWVCPLAGCIVKTYRMDLHLQHKHKICKDSDLYKKCKADAQIFVSTQTQVTNTEGWLNEALEERGKAMKHRCLGCRAKDTTIEKHNTAVRLFLPNLSKEKILALEDIGEYETGLVDQLLAQKQYKAETLRSYVGHLSSFLQWMSGRKQWLARLTMTVDEFFVIVKHLTAIKKTLKQDAAREAEL